MTGRNIMDALPYSIARKTLMKTMERVCDEHEPIIITRKNSRSVVMMSIEDYNSIQETAYLLRSPANAENLRNSIKQYEQGNYQCKDIIEG
jgi:antitoxin YefM